MVTWLHLKIESLSNKHLNSVKQCEINIVDAILYSLSDRQWSF